jgi:predicted MFS family arabinose efflux permease
MSCCNPRGPSPGALAGTVAITSVLAAVCGRPLVEMVTRLWDQVGPGWRVLVVGLAVVAAAGFLAVVVLRLRGDRQRRRCERESSSAIEAVAAPHRS